MRIEFLWFDDCPNHERARALLDEVLRDNGIDPAAVVESIRVEQETVVEHRFVGSPTIRVNGRDIDPAYQGDGPYFLACRVPGIPPRQWIESAIGAALQSEEP